MPTIKQRTSQPQAVISLTNAGIDPTLANLFAARGIADVSELDTGMEGLLPPSSMLNAERAGRILAKAIKTDKKILVACDFDVDGCSAGAVAIRGLKMMGAKHVNFKMPLRNLHGYGLGKLLVQEIHQQFAPDIILTVDCGVSSYEGIDEANKLGIFTLISDHHLCAADKPLPNAMCIVNPQQPGDEFKSKNIAGVGVIFYVMLALRAELRAQDYFTQSGIPDPNLATLLDLVALATIADVVKLDSNNRRLVANGIRRIKAGRACAGINALLEVAGKEREKVTATDLAFLISPRINSAGRLEDASLGVQCLTTDDTRVASDIATRLNALNAERKDIESQMKESAEIALEEVDVSGRFSLVMHDPSWHQGVIGILASRLKDRYGLPTIIFAKGDDGILKGSGRSIPGLHLRDAMDIVDKRHPGIFKAFGGHSAAAGASIVESRFDEFVMAFEKVVRELIDESVLQQVIETDGNLPNESMTIETIDKIEKNVWGQGFPEPLFDDEFVVIEQQILKDKHLKLKVAKNGAAFPAIWFFRKELLPGQARLVYSLSANEFRGEKTVQLMVRHAEVQ